MNIIDGGQADLHSDPEMGGDPLANSAPSATNPKQSFSPPSANDVQKSLMLVILASIVLLIAVCTWESKIESYGYAVTIPSLSMIVAFTGVMLSIFKEQIYTSFGIYIAKFLFAWNFSGACYLTFGSPFTTTGNGYFATWACVVTSGMTMGLSTDSLKSIKGYGSVMYLGASSVIVIIALIDYLGPDSRNRGESVYAMVVCSWTIVLCAGLWYLNKRAALDTTIAQNPNWAIMKFGAISFFAILWFILAFLVTFGGPFVTTGNGYFASWFGAVFAVSAAFDAKNETGIDLPGISQLSNFTNTSTPPEESDPDI